MSLTVRLTCSIHCKEVSGGQCVISEEKKKSFSSGKTYKPVFIMPATHLKKNDDKVSNRLGV